jgi:hypothetical protein
VPVPLAGAALEAIGFTNEVVRNGTTVDTRQGKSLQ